MPSIILVTSGDQQWALPQAAVQSLDRDEPSLGLVAALGLAAVPERYTLLTTAGHALGVAAADLVPAADLLALPDGLRGQTHPAVIELIVYNEMLIPYLDPQALAPAPLPQETTQ